MKKLLHTLVPMSLLAAQVVCESQALAQPRSLADAPRTIIAAVNEKDAAKYVSVFTEDAVVQVHGGPVRLVGRDELRANRERHFKAYPQAVSEIQHLVEIGDKVIMHDRVWLHGKDQAAADIVEIFTFRGGRIFRMEVIQPEGLVPPRQ